MVSFDFIVNAFSECCIKLKNTIVFNTWFCVSYENVSPWINREIIIYHSKNKCYPYLSTAWSTSRLLGFCQACPASGSSICFSLFFSATLTALTAAWGDKTFQAPSVPSTKHLQGNTFYFYKTCVHLLGKTLLHNWTKNLLRSEENIHSCLNKH